MPPLQRAATTKDDARASEAVAAGWIAGAVGQLIGYPLDTLKVRQQLLKSGPAKSLMAGWSGPVLTAGLINSLNFGTYDAVWRRIGDAETDLECDSRVVFAAGAAGGVAVSPLTCAVGRVKVLQQSCAFPGRTAYGVVRETVAAGGARSLWSGYGANLLMEANRGVYMLSFVGAKRALGGRDGPLPLWKRSLAGATAGIFSWLVGSPGGIAAGRVDAAATTRGRLWGQVASSPWLQREWFVG